jgi:hypothetical protein
MVLRLVRFAYLCQSLVKPLLKTTNAVRLIKITTINSDRGVYIPMPENLREGQVIFGMVFQPFDCENVAHQVRVHATASVAEIYLAYNVVHGVFGIGSALSVNEERVRAYPSQ